MLGVQRRPDGVWIRCATVPSASTRWCSPATATRPWPSSARATPERRILGAVRYQPTSPGAHRHRAAAAPPKVWSAWNYLAGAGAPDERPVSVSYLINRLQPCPSETPVVVSLNPFTEPAPDKLIRRIEYAHPVFDQAAVDAQAALPTIQGAAQLVRGAWTATVSTRTGSSRRCGGARPGGRDPWQPSAEAAASAARPRDALPPAARAPWRPPCASAR